MNAQDEQFMHRALQLAAYGRSTVSPNPMVGCVIVHNEKVIGEGWHQKAGEPHAEVLAIRSVKNEVLLKSAIAYVTLEPCAHHGKTPPCAELLVEKQVKKVVVGAVDPNPLVAGKGIDILRNAGIEVVQGVLESECLALNKAFFTFQQHHRPYVVLKWAETADGFIAKENFDSKWITHPLSRQLVHKWRAENDAILVGKNTMKYDNPKLTVRDWSGKNPIRIIVDHQLALIDHYKTFDGSERTIVFHHTDAKNISEHYELMKLPKESFLEEMMHYFFQQQIQSLFIEGGANTVQTFIDLGLWDEARIFTAPVQFGKGIKSPQLKNHRLVSQQNIQDKNQSDILSFYYKN